MSALLILLYRQWLFIYLFIDLVTPARFSVLYCLWQPSFVPIQKALYTNVSLSIPFLIQRLEPRWILRETDLALL